MPDLFAFMGGDDAFLRLVVQKDIHSYADLKGKTLSVDAITTGFAFVLRKMLQRNGILERDVSFESAGGVLQRFEALKAGKHAGTLVLTPFEFMAARAGLHVLQAASDICRTIRASSVLPARAGRKPTPTGWSGSSGAILLHCGGYSLRPIAAQRKEF